MILSDVCLVCGLAKPSKNKYYCSKKCMGLGKQGYKICPVCGTIFKGPSCNTKICCSAECSRKHRSDLHATGVYDESIKKMRKGFRGKVDEMDPEDFWKSKGWIIKSPSGQIYDVRNLMNFIRKHPELFDGTPRQAFDGFAKIKASRQGKRKNPSYTWKGWKLLEWRD